jgi:Cu+-exporting ATPase
MTRSQTIELPIEGMDCADCTRHVQKAVLGVPGVNSAEVYLVTEKAVIEVDAERVNLESIGKAVTRAGYSVGDRSEPEPYRAEQLNLSRKVGRLTAAIFVSVLLIVIVGELLGLFDVIMDLIPWWVGLVLVIIAGYPVFRGVVLAAAQRQVISHTLMTLGVIAALAVGEWLTALVVVFFMRVGDYVERFTTDQARKAILQLTALSPQTARVVREGAIVEVPIEKLDEGEIVEVRPGEKIPVDGEVVDGHATVDQSTITGESMPVDVGPGAHVFAATLAQYGSIRIRTTFIGPDTTFGHIISMVEEAESQKSEVQRFADKFSVYFLPIVAGIAAMTYIISGDALATAAVLVVACSCSIALATPIAMLASIGAAAKSGLLIKGGKYLEVLARADILLLDKTGTLTLGRPKVSNIVAINGFNQNELLLLAASAERYSEHPIAEAVRSEARLQQLDLLEPDDFMAYPGKGIRALVGNVRVTVGNQKLVTGEEEPLEIDPLPGEKTKIFVGIDDDLVGMIAITDTLRTEVPEALDEIRDLGLNRIELLTGDNEQVARELASELGINYQSGLLPEDKIQVVKQYQEQGLTVVMVGDGVNDAPALAQADVGIAMGAAGSDIALEASDAALMSDDWHLVPELFRISQRTMRIVKMNLGLTGVYNIVGLTLAAAGLLPPILAAAAQSLPDLGILANSSRLLKQ